MTEREQARYRASHGEEPKLEKNVWRANPEVCTKFVRLLDDLRALRADEPDFRVVVFSEHDIVQQLLARYIGGRAKEEQLTLFEFNSKTPPVKRHKLMDVGKGVRVLHLARVEAHHTDLVVGRRHDLRLHHSFGDFQSDAQP